MLGQACMPGIWLATHELRFICGWPRREAESRLWHALAPACRLDRPSALTALGLTTTMPITVDRSGNPRNRRNRTPSFKTALLTTHAMHRTQSDRVLLYTRNCARSCAPLQECCYIFHFTDRWALRTFSHSPYACGSLDPVQWNTYWSNHEAVKKTF